MGIKIIAYKRRRWKPYNILFRVFILWLHKRNHTSMLGGISRNNQSMINWKNSCRAWKKRLLNLPSLNSFFPLDLCNAEYNKSTKCQTILHFHYGCSYTGTTNYCWYFLLSYLHILFVLPIIHQLVCIFLSNSDAFVIVVSNCCCLSDFNECCVNWDTFCKTKIC